MSPMRRSRLDVSEARQSAPHLWYCLKEDRWRGQDSRRVGQRCAVRNLDSSALQPDLRIIRNSSIVPPQCIPLSFSMTSLRDLTGRSVISFHSTNHMHALFGAGLSVPLHIDFRAKIEKLGPFLCEGSSCPIRRSSKPRARIKAMRSFLSIHRCRSCMPPQKDLLFHAPW
jgi:hypothetical protein